MTNKSLRERFGIDDKNSAMVSRIISDAVSVGLIKRENVDESKKYSRYVPFWA
jgi:predicted HTH transcriptional regulator